MHQQFGPEEGEHRACTGLRVQPVGEAGFHPGGLEHEGQRAPPRGQAGRQALGVAGALHFHAAEGSAFFLGFDDAAGLAVDVQQVVGKAVAGFQGKFADGDAGRCPEVGVGHIADVPARCGEQRVNGLAGTGLGRHVALGVVFSSSGILGEEALTAEITARRVSLPSPASRAAHG